MVRWDGLVPLRTADGALDSWGPVGLRVPGSPYIGKRPWLRRWVPEHFLVEAGLAVPGAVEFDLELRDNAAYAWVRNRTPYRLQAVTVVWGRSAAVRLPDLPPGAAARRLLARVGGGR